MEKRPPRRHASLPQRKPKEDAPLEAAIIKSIRTALGRLPRCYHYKTHGSPFDVRGQPDIVGCLDGLAFAIEVKRPGEKLTKLQEKALKNWREAGAMAFMATSVNEALAGLGR